MDNTRNLAKYGCDYCGEPIEPSVSEQGTKTHPHPGAKRGQWEKVYKHPWCGIGNHGTKRNY